MSTTTKWVIDPMHSEIGFKVKHMMISTVSGHFGSFAGTVETSNDNFSDAKAALSVDIQSISTKNTDRDNHLKSPDFFNAEEFPTMTFESVSFNDGTLTGELTIRGTKKVVDLDVNFNGIAVDPYGQTKAGFEISGEINRKEFGLAWGAVTEAGSIVVSDKVKLVADVQFIKQ